MNTTNTTEKIISIKINKELAKDKAETIFAHVVIHGIRIIFILALFIMMLTFETMVETWCITGAPAIVFLGCLIVINLIALFYIWLSKH